MRALLDVNVYISYLLSSVGGTPPVRVVEAAFAGAYELLVTAGVIEELRRTTTTKPYLAARITRVQVERFISFLSKAESIPEIEGPLPEVGEDRKDDYLFAHALMGRADYLVSGDDHLVAVGRVDGVEIVTPARFLAILRATGRV